MSLNLSMQSGEVCESHEGVWVRNFVITNARKVIEVTQRMVQGSGEGMCQLDVNSKWLRRGKRVFVLDVKVECTYQYSDQLIS